MPNNLVKSMYYGLSIAGKQFDADRLALVEEIVHEDNEEGSDLLTVVINDPDFEFLADDILFLEEQTVSFVGGWTDDIAISFSGYISVVDVDFPSNGLPRIILHCMDETHVMNREKKKKTWHNTTVASVVSEIYGNYGFGANVDSSGRVEQSITQTDLTDIEFIRSLAEKEHDDFYIYYVENGVGHFKKRPILESPQETLVYRDTPFDIESFSPRVNKEKKRELVNKQDVNDENKKIGKVDATESTGRPIQGKPVITSSSKLGSSTVVTTKFTGDGWTDVITVPENTQKDD